MERATHVVPTCTFCETTLKDTVHVECAECSPPIIICLECFSTGKQTESHSKGHQYHIKDANQAVLYTKGWHTSEEVTLLTTIERVGLGNWADVAAVLKHRTPKECEHHYFSVYVTGTQTPIERTPFEPEEAPTAANPTLTTDDLRPAQLGPEYASLYPKRGDYGTDYNNDIEREVSDIVMYPEDDLFERRLKIAMLEVYNCNIQKRVQRHKFVKEYGLNDPAKINDVHGSAEISKHFSVLKKFARFHSPSAHQSLLMKMAQQARLRRRIKHLQELAKAGITDYQGEKKYIAYKEQREAQMQAKETSRRRAPLQPQMEELSVAESRFCSRSKLSLDTYWHLKRQLVIHRDATLDMKCDPSLVHRAQQFFEEQGWF
eukprot:m.14402 g.14402  ORF g.14402 m.14402 type:complete len:375 (+) comp6266_c0_seq1:166-1290(+)